MEQRRSLSHDFLTSCAKLCRRVQLVVVWCAGVPAAESPVGAKRRRSSIYQYMVPWPHHSGVASASLAASPETSGI